MKKELLGIYTLVQSDLKKVDTYLIDTLKKGCSKSSINFIDHVLNSSGKRIRPILTLLCMYASNPSLKSLNPELIKVAAATELIHMASLVHDDVIDDADIRRDQISIKGKWGNAAAVSFGVYLYSISLKLMSEAGNLEALASLSDAVKHMCEGELVQLSNRKGTHLTLSEYLNILHSKTAALFSSACEIGSLFGNPELKEPVSKYGYELGMLFQLTDDCLDYFGDQEDLNKKIGQDFFQGQLTLPTLLLLDTVDDRDKLTFETIIRSRSEQDLKTLLTLFEKYRIQEACQAFLDDYFNRAKTNLDSCSSTKYKTSLETLLSIIYKRANLRLYETTS